MLTAFLDAAKTGWLRVHADGFLRLGGVGFLDGADGLVALGTKLHEGLGFSVEAGHIAVDDGLPDDAEGGLGAEIVLVVELVHHLHDVLDGQAGILDVGHLVAAIVASSPRW